MPRKFQGPGGIGEDLLESGLQSLAGMAEAAEAISAEAEAGTRRAVAAGSAVFGRFAAAKSLGEVLAIQTDGARQGYEILIAATSRMNQLYAELARRACRPFEDSIATPSSRKADPLFG